MAMSQTRFIVTFDGGARGNPGIAGAGFVIKKNTNNTLSPPLQTKAIYVGDHATNNEAEYTGVIEALGAVIEFVKGNIITKKDRVEILGDSKLIINQLNGVYKVKSANLVCFYKKAIALLDALEKMDVFVKLDYIPRRENKEADAMANKAMDAKSSVVFNNINEW